MASLKILVPDGTTNYVLNPAFRYDVTGWTSVGAAAPEYSLDYARFNIASAKIVTNGVALSEGTYYKVTGLVGISEPITASIYVRGTGMVRLRLVESLGKTWTSADVKLSSTRWQRISVSGYSTGSSDIRLYVETASRVQATTFYLDGAQLERHPYVTSYCDGDQEDCFWNVVAHASVSTRPATTRAGGRWVSLGGCEREESNLYFTVIGGLGAAPIKNGIQPFADAPGSYFQSTKVLDRLITITFFTKAPKFRRNTENSLNDLHKLRQMLFDIVKPDATAGAQEFLIEYQDGTTPIYFKARYDGGLEGEWDVRNQWVNSFPVRLLAVSPFLTEDDQEVAQLTFQRNLTVNFVMRRFDGDWSEMNGGFNTNYVLGMALGSHGEIIAVGDFFRANYKATAVDPLIWVYYVSYWDGTQWQKFGVGANGVIRAVAVAPNGDVYVTGSFTSIGGVAANRVARWVRATSSWQAMSTGLNATGRAIKVAPNGNVYVGGEFTTAGTSNARYIARWDGSNFQPLGALGGLNQFVNAIAISSDGSQVYAGGDFTDEYTSPGVLALNYVGLYVPTTDDWWELADGFNGHVLALTMSPSNRLYAGGEFTEAGNSTGQVLLYIAYFNGAQWFDMNSGANNYVRGIDVSPLGQVLAVGDFTRIGGVDTPYVGLWNGSTWVGLDINIGLPCYAGIFDKNGNIYIGTSATVQYSGLTTVQNIGSAEVSPILYIKGPATLKWIENQTAKKRFFADLDILTDEEVFIDFAHGTALSSVRGDLAFAIIAGSDFRSWKLLPGANTIAALMENDMSAKMQLSYVPRHWSVDATNRVDAF